MEARRAHNPEVGGSSPPPATRKEKVIPIGMAFSFLPEAEEDSNPSECDSPVDCRLPPAGWRQHYRFRQRRKSKSSPPPATKKQDSLWAVLFFYPCRRLGMESRFSVHGIAEGVWHHRRCIFLRLDSMRCSASVPFRLTTDSIHGFAVIYQ